MVAILILVYKKSQEGVELVIKFPKNAKELYTKKQLHFNVLTLIVKRIAI